jgi:AcrR family transcriptional regulator
VATSNQSRAVAGKTPRPRRSGEQARGALLEAAASTFARHGYGGASTKQIAQAAGTSETAIYNGFGSKSELFKAAVLEPFEAFLEQYTADFRRVMASGRDDEQLVRDCVADLYDHLHANLDSVRALISASNEPAAQPVVHQAVAGLQAMFDEMTAMTFEAFDAGAAGDRARVPTWHRLIHGMILSITVLEPLFMPEWLPRPTREELLETATDFVLYGTVGVKRPDPEGA